MRIQQWVKNLAIFLPLFFGAKLFDHYLLLKSLHAFLGFSFVASAVYILNDLRDIEHDRQHPEKRNRPLAAGKISKNEALIIIITALVLGLFFIWTIPNNHLIFSLIGLYFGLNILYSFWLKKVALIDVCIIALGFVIRIFVGSASTGIFLSHWIIVITFLLALFMAFGKRRDDLILLSTSGVKARSNLDGYNLDFINAAILMSAAVVVVSYILYTTSADVIARTGQHIYVTSFFVVLGMLRYLQLIYVYDRSGNPTKIFLSDRFLQIVMLAWLVCFGSILYLKL